MSHGHQRSNESTSERVPTDARGVRANPESGSDADGNTRTIDRREYLKFGAATVATVVGVGTGLSAATSSEQTQTSFSTDFSEYAA